MKTRLLNLIVSSLLVGYFFLSPPQAQAAQGEYPACKPNTSCVVGEFLYDDNYSPISTATCTITSRYPDGTVYLNAAAMTAASDGWYSYTFTTAATEGIYRTQICCTASPDYLCLDKTFKVSASSGGITAADVWNYNDRQLTGFGSLVSDIWGYSSRSLSSFGSLVSDIWSTTTRTITGGSASGGGYEGSEADIKSILNLSQENRRLLEKLVNKPVIKTFIDDNPTSLQSKIERSRTISTQLYSSIQDIKSRAQLLDLKWKSLSASDISNELSTINKLLKDDQLREGSSVLASTTWLKNSWNSFLTLSLSDQAVSAQSKVEQLIGDISLYGKTDSPQTFKSALKNIEKIDTLVGTSLSDEGETTLFGFIKKEANLASYFNQKRDDISTAITKIELTDSSKIDSITQEVLKKNLVPTADSILTTPTNNSKYQTKNKALALLSLIQTNLNFLNTDTGKTVANVWLEEGSIVFRAVVTNPSASISQKVPVEIFLPEELGKEKVIKNSPELTIGYNNDELRLEAKGEVTLKPLESKTYFVEVEDIWKFDQTEIDGLKKQANDLLNNLKGTNFYGQASSIKGDIDVTLDKVMLKQKESITPESRIKSYRESRLDIAGVSEKMTTLKTFVSQSSGSNLGRGLLGGLQIISILGIAIIVIGGIFFLFIYLRELKKENKPSTSTPVRNQAEVLSHINLPNRVHKHLPPKHPYVHKFTKLISIIILTSGFGALGTSYFIRQSSYFKKVMQPITSKISSKVLGVSTTKNNKEGLIEIPKDKEVILYTGPDEKATQIGKLTFEASVYIFSEKNGFVQVAQNPTDVKKRAWVKKEFVK